MLGLLLLAFAILVLPTAATVLWERSWRTAWGIVSDGWVPAGEGAYREVLVARRSAGRAPNAVLVAAWSCFFLGQWIVPGALVAFVGLMVSAEIPWARNPVLIVSALSAPSGLLLAARNLGLGAGLLSRDFAIEARARSTARWTFVHNGVLIAAMVVAAVFDGDEEAIVMAGTTCVWALVSVAHAVLLRRAASSIERHEAREWIPEAEPASAA
jgi:hypothetical protein